MVGCMNRKRWEMQSSKKRRGKKLLSVGLPVLQGANVRLLVLLPSYHLSVSLSVCLLFLRNHGWNLKSSGIKSCVIVLMHIGRYIGLKC